MRSLLLFASALVISACGFVYASSDGFGTGRVVKNKILKVDMHLSAFGVESDDFPSIAACIDFTHTSNECVRTYYNPAFKGSTYHLSSEEMKQVLALLQQANFDTLKKRYHVSKTDQPTSSITVYTEGKTYSIEDYGLAGEYPLQKLYSLVYKL